MSKVIFKMKFEHPNLKSSASKNSSHVMYIATRPGADKSLTQSDLEKELKKGVENLDSDNELYAKYIAERPNSHGLFGPDGIENPKEIQEIFENHDSFVWRGIISLKEIDAKEIGFIDKDKWQEMLRKKLPDIGEKMGIPYDNLKWVGAIHMEKGHPHAHVMIWEDVPKKHIGIISGKKIVDIRKLLTDEIFEGERMSLLSEKNIMRDVVNDLAEGDVSKASRIIKDVKDLSEELDLIVGNVGPVGVEPRLYSEQEIKISMMVKDLATIMPGKGRVALKFMPIDVKDKVGEIADYVLAQPGFQESLLKHLNAVEELTKIYTGKPDDIQKAKDNAYKDIRDRVSQTILKGAVESMKENWLIVDNDLSKEAVIFINRLDGVINLKPENKAVFEKIAVGLMNIGHDDDTIMGILKDFTQKESLSISEEDIKKTLEVLNSNPTLREGISQLSPNKKIDYFLSTMKLSGVVEKDAYEHLFDVAHKDRLKLDGEMKRLSSEGLFTIEDDRFMLTDKGVTEVLKIKELDSLEKKLFNLFEDNNDLSSPEKVEGLSFDDLIDNKDVFSLVIDTDPEELKLSKFDAKVRNYFGEENRITISELEEFIYEQYSDEDTSKADQEFDIVKNRIDKLALNGFVNFDKDSGIYLFAEEWEKHFEYREEQGSWNYKDESLEELGISTEIEFTLYDANLTLGYIDRCENGMLELDELQNTLYKEIVNKTAVKQFNDISDLFEMPGKSIIEKYVVKDEDGLLSASKDGSELSKSIHALKKVFDKIEGPVTESAIRKVCSSDAEYTSTMTLVNKLSVEHDEAVMITKDNSYLINPKHDAINKLMFHLYKEGGSFKVEDLKSVLEKNIPNKEAISQFKYLSRRLNALKEQGYLIGEGNTFSITHKGIEKRKDLLQPQRGLLKKKIAYLTRLGLLKQEGVLIKTTNLYNSYMKKTALSKEKGIERFSALLSKDVLSLVERTRDNVDVAKIERVDQKRIRGKYMTTKYEDIETSYTAIRSHSGVVDTSAKTISNVSRTLMLGGMNSEDVKKVVSHWNEKNQYMSQDKFDELFDKVDKGIRDDLKWGRTTIINKEDWDDTFKSLGVSEEKIPKWMYKGENWTSFKKNHGLSFVSDMWKSMFSEFEKQKMITDMKANSMRKQLSKQSAMSSKSARVEQGKKNKDRGSIGKDDDLEM